MEGTEGLNLKLTLVCEVEGCWAPAVADHKCADHLSLPIAAIGIFAPPL